MSVRSVLYLLALILAGGLLFIVGAVVVLAYRDPSRLQLFRLRG